MMFHRRLTAGMQLATTHQNTRQSLALRIPANRQAKSRLVAMEY